MRRRVLFALLVGVAAAGVPATAAAQRAEPRIIKGTPAAPGQYPYQVQIQSPSGAGFCGGVIRDQTHVLTAAHCVTSDPDGPLVNILPPAPVDRAELRVFYGSNDTNARPFPVATVARLDVMPQYLAGSFNHDAALLTLDGGGLQGYGGPAVNRIPFATAGELAAGVGQGQSAVATGWGRTSNSSQATTNQLQAVSLALRGDESCSQLYGGEFSPALGVCAGGTGTDAADNPDTCNGDSGGPLALPTPAGLKLVGLTSFGRQDCGGPSEPAVYTETSNAEVCAFLGAQAECNPPPPPPAARTVRDTTRPAARITSLRCKKRTCSFRVRTRDNSGAVRSLSTRVYRRVRTCRVRGGRRTCRTVMRNKKIRTKKIPGGYSGKTKLNVARYRLDAVATDAAGNRSKPARKRFGVKRR